MKTPTLDRPLSRRTVLRGAGGIAVGLPLLEAMSPRRAQAAPGKRYIFNFFSNGVTKDTWTPAGGETGFTLPSTLAPLQPLQNKLVVLTGLNLECSRHDPRGPGNPHNQGIVTLTTGRRFLPERPGGGVGWGADLSFDQAIAAKVGQQTKYPSLQFGVQTLRFYGASYHSYVSYSGPNKPVPNEDDPAKMFQRIFTDVVGSTAAPGALAAQEERLARRRSLLDFVGGQFKQLTVSLPAGDRAKVDGHLEKIREIERRLAFSSGSNSATSAGCQKPVLREVPGAMKDNSAFPAAGKLQMDLLAMAMTCDLTRVATLQWGTAQAFNTFPWCNSPRAHHPMSHETAAGSLTMLRQIQRWFVEQLAYLAGALDAAKEQGGSILDSAALLSCTEVAVGNTHSFVDMPFLLLGGAGGAIKGGRHLRFPAGTPHNDLYVAIMNAMGIPGSTFGDPNYSKGPLTGLLG